MSPIYKTKRKVIKLSDLKIETGNFIVFALEVPLLKPFQMASILNIHLDLDLRRQLDLDVFNRQQQLESHLLYTYQNDECQVLLIDHKHPQVIFPQYASCDYLFLFKMEKELPISDSYTEDFLDLFQKHPDIFSVDLVPQSPKVEDLIIDIETHSSKMLQKEREDNPPTKLLRRPRR